MQHSKKGRYLIVADPLDSLNPWSDTGLSMAREALDQGAEVWWAQVSNITVENNQAFAHANRLEKFLMEEIPKPVEFSRGLLNDFNGIWVRKDPPFNSGYTTLCWILSLCKPEVRIINSPSVLLRFHEKLIHLKAVAEGYLSIDQVIPTWVVHGSDNPIEVPKHWKNDEFITKPWFGYGGKNIEKWESAEAAIKSLKKNEPNIFSI